MRRIRHKVSFEQAGIQSFPFSPLVTIPRLKSPVYFTFLLVARSWIPTFPKKYKQSRSGFLTWFEVSSSCDDNHNTKSAYLKKERKKERKKEVNWRK